MKLAGSPELSSPRTIVYRTTPLIEVFNTVLLCLSRCLYFWGWELHHPGQHLQGWSHPQRRNQQLSIPQPHRTHPSLPETRWPRGGDTTPGRSLAPTPPSPSPASLLTYPQHSQMPWGDQNAVSKLWCPNTNTNPMHPTNGLYPAPDICNTFVSVLTGKCSP